jgi:hypothetical protein
MSTYYDRRTDIKYRIVGFLREEGGYEVYHGKSTSPVRDIILHLRKTGDERIYPNASKINEVIAVPSKPVGRMVTEQVLPWETRGVDLVELEVG